MSTKIEPAANETSTPQVGLKGQMGVLQLVFTVVAYNGPIVVFAGFLPLVVLIGNGVGTPVAFLVCGAVIALLAYGLIKMSSKLDRPGGFYALITAGLGRVSGLAAGLISIACYFAAMIGVYALGGVGLNRVVSEILGGPDLPWYLYGGIMLLIVAPLGYFNINLSARVLTILLLAEVALVVVYDIAVLVRGGADGIGFESFSAPAITSGSIGLALLLGIGLYGGFEATVIFRDEVKNPRRTIPIATIAVIAGLAVLYSVSAWLFINSYGAHAVMEVVTADYSVASTESVREYVGPVAYDLVTIMIFTSSLALAIAAHNVTSRYLFNLSVDGIFPKKLGSAHVRHVSPHRASLVVTVASVIALVVTILLNVDSSMVYYIFAGIYAYAFVMMLTFVSLAVAVYLFKNRAGRSSIVGGVLASVAFLIFAITLVLATQNFTLLTATEGVGQVILLSVIWGFGIVGAVLALILRVRKPEVYARIGRQ
jgi:amino acid transporter